MSSTKLLLNPAPPQPHKVMGFKLSKEALDLITTLTAGGNPPKIQVQFGSNPTFIIGSQTFHFQVISDTAPPNVYRLSPVPPDLTTLTGLSASKPPTAALDLVGSLTHRCTIRRELSDDLKHKMKSATAAADHKSHGRQVKILEAGEAMQLGTSKHSMTAAAARGGSTKSAAGAKGAVMPRGAISTVTSPDSGRAGESGGGIPLRQRLIQLLAKTDLSTDSLVKFSKAAKKDVTTILNEIAAPKGSSWSLKLEVYKEVKIWNWTFEDREIKEVINNARKAYEKLNYPQDAKERANLNPPTVSTKFSSSMVQTQTKKLKSEPESRTVKRPKADLASTDSSTDTKPKVAAKKAKKAAVTPLPKRVSAAVAVATDGARKVNSSTTTTRLKPTPSANGKPPPPSASSSSSGLTNGGGTAVNGTTPKPLPTIDDLLSSTANGTVVVSSAKETNHVNNGTKRKERGDDAGGGGEAVKAGGYKIRKRGTVVAGAAGTVRGTGMGAEKEDLDTLDISKPYIPPRITSQTEYHRLYLHFKDKYDEYRRADIALDKHRDLIDALRDVDRLQRPSSADASAAKHKYEEYGGKEGRWGEVLKTAERYVKLHKELEAIKAELWRAYNQGIGGANGGANGLVNGAGGGT